MSHAIAVGNNFRFIPVNDALVFVANERFSRFFIAHGPLNIFDSISGGYLKSPLNTSCGEAEGHLKKRQLS
jgi:hypothetical protein